MSRPPRTVIEYRNYELPADFPIQMLSGENWRISDVPSGVLHFHNCLEIGLCESDGGFLGFQSLSSFNRHFLAEMGTTPSQWRSAAGNNPKTSILKYRGWMTPPKD